MLSLGLKVVLVIWKCQIVVEFARLRILSTNKVALDERQLLRVGPIRAVNVVDLVHSVLGSWGKSQLLRLLLLCLNLTKKTNARLC